MSVATAADRYAHELADARIRVGMRDVEVDRLRAGIRAAAYLAGQASLREMLEALLRGDDEDVPL
jgi:hypothetical protein